MDAVGSESLLDARRILEKVKASYDYATDYIKEVLLVLKHFTSSSLYEY